MLLVLTVAVCHTAISTNVAVTLTLKKKEMKINLKNELVHEPPDCCDLFGQGFSLTWEVAIFCQGSGGSWDSFWPWRASVSRDVMCREPELPLTLWSPRRYGRLVTAKIYSFDFGVNCPQVKPTILSPALKCPALFVFCFFFSFLMGQ